MGSFVFVDITPAQSVTLQCHRAPVPPHVQAQMRAANALRYAGPERRAPSAREHHRTAQLMDALDYGMLLLTGEARVVHINQAARRDLDARHPLLVQAGELRTRHAHDAPALHDAIAEATQRGLRHLLTLGDSLVQSTVAVVPLPTAGAHSARAVLLVLGKRQLCEELTVDWYARSKGLTPAETAVIRGLCADLTPHQIARLQGVGLATIRSQIGSIRLKTGLGGIKAVVRELAVLPPLVSALRGQGAAPPDASPDAGFKV